MGNWGRACYSPTKGGVSAVSSRRDEWKLLPKKWKGEYDSKLALEEVIFDRLRYFIYGSGPFRFFDFLVHRYAGQSELRCNFAIHPNDCSNFPFCKEENLKHQVVSLVGSSS